MRKHIKSSMKFTRIVRNSDTKDDENENKELGRQELPKYFDQEVSGSRYINQCR